MLAVNLYHFVEAIIKQNIISLKSYCKNSMNSQQIIIVS